VVQVLVEQGADLDAQSNWGFCPLHLTWDADIVDLLVNAGAKVDLMSSTGESPLHKAAARFNVEGVLTLLRHGALVNLKEEGGYTPLHFLCRCLPESAELIQIKRGRG